MSRADDEGALAVGEVGLDDNTLVIRHTSEGGIVFL